VKNTETFVFLLTHGILLSFWCLQELEAAIEHKKKIVVIRELSYTLPTVLPVPWQKVESILRSPDQLIWMAEYNTACIEQLKERIGLNISSQAISLEDKAEALQNEGQFEKAGEIYVQAAELWMQEKSKWEASTDYRNAAKNFKKVKPTDALAPLQNAVQLCKETHKYEYAARSLQEIAEIYEKDSKIENAIEAYEEAANYYDKANAPSTRDRVRATLVQCCVNIKKYDKAIINLEMISKVAVLAPLLKYSVKTYLLGATICRFALGNLQETKEALKGYAELDPNFASSREYSFLTQLVEATNQKEYFDALNIYEQIAGLDAWKKNILVNAGNLLKKE